MLLAGATDTDECGIISTVLTSIFFFFFSSRRRHTRWNCDWSSDVCSSDLLEPVVDFAPQAPHQHLEHVGERVVVVVPHVRRDGGAIQHLSRMRDEQLEQIGRASCRERVYISVVAVSLKKNNGRGMVHGVR